LKTENEIIEELAEWEAQWGRPKRDDEGPIPPEITDDRERAKFYAIWHGMMFGLGYEVLYHFYKNEESTPGEHWANANDALYEWDI
jgi:hypothetical protein